MDGRRALIYSRVRENRLDPSENDLTRGERQQEVVEAMTDKLVGPGTFVRLPFIGGDLVKPLTTDLSAGQLVQLGWVKFRANASRALHCRLGGEPQSIGGESVLVGTEENTRRDRDVHRPLGAAAAAARARAYGAGCVVGRSRRPSRPPRPSSRRRPSPSRTSSRTTPESLPPPSFEPARSSCGRRARSRSSRSPSP